MDLQRHLVESALEKVNEQHPVIICKNCCKLSGQGIDLFLIPGVAFTLSGGRMGHGMGYYDKYLKTHLGTYPNKKTTLMALAFREQIIDEDSLPLDAHDVRMHTIITV